jgi:hypothetical protein
MDTLQLESWFLVFNVSAIAVRLREEKESVEKSKETSES